mgnify:CR=1 FL=1
MGKYRKHDISLEWARAVRHEIRKVEDQKEQEHLRGKLLKAYRKDSMRDRLALSKELSELSGSHRGD